MKIDMEKVMKELAKRGVTTSMHYDKDRGQFYVDLNTQAKSHLHLYEDGTIRGRYDYETKISLNLDAEDLIYALCYEFNRALCGRNYYQSGWGELCKLNEIGLKIWCD